MKKIILSSLAISAMFFSACSSGEGCCVNSSASNEIEEQSELIYPTAVITGLTSTSYLVDESIRFDGSTSTDDKSIVEYVWTIDGQTYTEQMVDVTFDTTGEKLVTLTVTDNDNLTNQTQTTITITEPSSQTLPPVAVISTNGTPLTYGSDYTFSCTDSYDQDENGASIELCTWDIAGYMADGTLLRNCPQENTGLTDATVTPCQGVGYILVNLTVTDNEGETNVTSERFDVQ